MEPVACGHCGKCDDEANMFVCSGCFEFHFCSEDHFNQHSHSKIEDAQHFDPKETIGPNIRRVFTKGHYGLGLRALIKAFVADVESSTPYHPSVQQYFEREISKSRRSEFSEKFDRYLKNLRLAARQNTMAEAKQTISSVSLELIDIWARENRLALRQKKQAIINAWSRFNSLLLRYRFSSDADRPIALADVEDVVDRVARVLGGGKDEFKEDFEQ
jgi:hypothetical protein